MKSEKTLSIIKPDAVKKGATGFIISMLETHGLTPIAMKHTLLTREQAENFYAVHKHRPFYQELVEFMISGPVVVMALEGVDAVAKNRTLMGSTDPAKADKGTIRRLFASSIGENAVHGSDSLENAAIEVKFFFPHIDTMCACSKSGNHK